MEPISLREHIKVFEVIDSTNTYMKQHYHDLPHQSVVRANFQLTGRGQFDRTWESKSGENILASILFKEAMPFDSRSINPIIVSALLSLLNEYGIQAHFKDPNDIYVGQKKICGILIETKYDHNALKYMIIGIGLNVNQTDFKEEKATSIKQIMQTQIDLNELFKRLLMLIENNLLLVRLLKREESHEY
jgi:BirA family transcriptional regulator, biotin operon repressor / biotin---[acetyl-CoA-carboxylase] ligase